MAYGIQESNPITKFDRANQKAATRMVDWTAKGLKITRLRLLSDPGLNFWDVSYCDGIIGDEPVRVQVPFMQLPKRGMQREIVKHAKRDGVYAKGIGILSATSTLC